MKKRNKVKKLKSDFLINIEGRGIGVSQHHIFFFYFCFTFCEFVKPGTSNVDMI
jgi:hypothetical protein